MTNRRWKVLLGGGWVLFGAIIGLGAIVNLMARAYLETTHSDNTPPVLLFLGAEIVVGAMMVILGFGMRHNKPLYRLPALVISALMIVACVAFAVWLTREAFAGDSADDASLLLIPGYLIAMIPALGAGLTIWTYLQHTE